MKKKNILYIALLAMIALNACNPASSKNEKNKTKTVEKQKETNQNRFFISKQQLNDAGMKLAKIKTDTFYYEVSAQGYLDVPPSNKAIISSFMTGKVEDLHLLVGNKVKRGQLLLKISNPGFLLMQQKYLKAKEDLTYLKQEYERQKSLAADSITSQKKLQKSRNTYLNMLANYQTLRQQLTLLHFDLKEVEKGNFSTLSPVYAPISGYITILKVTRGSHVNPSKIIMEIIDNSYIHLELRIFEKDVLKLKTYQPIEFMIPDMGTEIFHGTVHLIGKKIDAKSRTVLVHGNLASNHPAFITVCMWKPKSLPEVLRSFRCPPPPLSNKKKTTLSSG